MQHSSSWQWHPQSKTAQQIDIYTGKAYNSQKEVEDCTRIPCFSWTPLAGPGSRDALGCHCMLLLRRVLRERLRLRERRVSSLPLLSTIWQNSVTVLVSF